jgi:hypothetical protein
MAQQCFTPSQAAVNLRLTQLFGAIVEWFVKKEYCLAKGGCREFLTLPPTRRCSKAKGRNTRRILRSVNSSEVAFYPYTSFMADEDIVLEEAMENLKQAGQRIRATQSLMRSQGMTEGENHRDLLTRLSTALAMTEVAYLEARRRRDLYLAGGLLIALVRGYAGSRRRRLRRIRPCHALG